MQQPVNFDHFIKTPESSNIQAFGYSEEHKLLRVQFKSEKFYDYYEVPPEEFQDLKEAQSKGAHLKRVLEKKYEFKEVTP